MITKSLEQICDLITDGTHYTPPDFGSGFPFLTVKDMTCDGLDFQNCSYVEEAEFEKARHGNCSPVRGDVLFSKDGTVGKIHVVRETVPFAVLSSIAILRPNHTIVDSGYLGHMLGAPATLAQAASLKTGSALRRIVLSDLRKIKIPLPSLPEQKRIAAILDKAEAIRRKRQQAVKLTEELLRSVFLDMFGDPVTNPKGWKVKPLAEEITFMTSGSRGWAEHYSDHGSKFIRIQNVKNGQLHFNDIQYVKAPDNKEAARTKVQENDLLISITADLGRTAVVDKQTAEEGAHINQHLALVRLSNAINPHFVAAYLESQGGKRQFLQLDQAAVKSGLNFDSIKSLRIFNPPLVLQEQYAAAVESVENTKVRLKGAADTSDTLFTSLLQRAFRGEL